MRSRFQKALIIWDACKVIINLVQLKNTSNFQFSNDRGAKDALQITFSFSRNLETYAENGEIFVAEQYRHLAGK